jgi:phosphate transport system substrate-binding protein
VSEKSAQKPEVREFVDYYLTQSIPLIEEVKYVPLPKQAYELALKHFRDGKVGTGFGGVPEVGLKVEELLAREAKL